MSDLEHIDIERLKAASEMSLMHYQKPLAVCISGGKDSSVITELAIRAGIPVEFMHNHTTADAPETVRFVRSEFKRLEELAAIDTPVWIQRMNDRDLCDDGWAIVYGPICLTKVNGVLTSWSITVWWFGNEVEDYPEYKNYGKTWIAYRSKPKE